MAVSAGLAAALAASLRSIYARNRTSQWLDVDLAGAARAPDPEELDYCVLTALSLLRHGVATPALVAEHDVLAILALVRHGMADADLIAELEGAIAAWRAFRRWREDELPAEIAARLVRALAERDRQARWREELAAGGKLPRRGVR